MNGILYSFMIFFSFLVSFTHIQHKFLDAEFAFKQGLRHGSFATTHHKAIDSMTAMVSSHGLPLQVQKSTYHDYPRFFRVKGKIGTFVFERSVMEEIMDE